MTLWRGVDLREVELVEPAPGELRLRPYRPGDAEAVLAGMGDPDAARFLDVPNPYTRADAVQFCGRTAPAEPAAGRGLELAMTLADDVAVGGVSLRLPPTPLRGAEIGYTVYPGARGHGLAGRATRLLTAWAFAHDVRRVELRVVPTNLASARTALRAGFGFESIARDAVGAGGQVADAAVFARRVDDDGSPVAPWLPPFDGIGDDVLLLRQFGPGDEDVVVEDVADAESRRWAVGDPCADPVRFAADRARLAPLRRLVGPSTRLVGVDRASGATAVVLEIRQAGPPEVAEVGYFTREPFRGRGLTSRAVRLWAHWAFTHAGIARLELGADVGNVASHRVAHAAGFTREGVSPARLRHPDGGYRDEVRYGRVRPPGDTGQPVRRSSP